MSGPVRRRDGLCALSLLALAPWALADTAPAPPAPPAPSVARGERVAWPAAVPLLDGGTWRPRPGRAVVVVFWSTTCPYCQRHNQHVEKLHRALQGRAATVLGAARDADPAVVMRYMARHQLTFPVTMAWRDLASALSERRVMPLTVTVDRDGRLREVIPGEMFESDVLGLAALAG